MTSNLKSLIFNWRGVCLAVAIVTCAGLLHARTVPLKPVDMDRVAIITEAGPRYSWATYESPSGIYHSAPVFLTPTCGMLVHYPLDKIPKGQRITYAELTVPVSSFNPQQARLYIWRLLVEWGAGVCHEFRMIRPKKEAWTAPGARGNSSDRSTKPSAPPLRMTEPGEKTINVTEDVELWYTGAAPNHGWLFTVEDKDAYVQLQSPAYDGTASWELRITYEPQ